MWFIYKSLPNTLSDSTSLFIIFTFIYLSLSFALPIRGHWSKQMAAIQSVRSARGRFPQGDFPGHRHVK